jgi:iron complex outermembrane receptor protein
LKKFILVLCLIGLFNDAYPQKNACNIRIQGIVRDSSENRVLNLSNIEIIGSPHQTESNAKGEFELNNLCPGPIEIHVSHLNCEHLHLSFVLLKDTFINIYVKHEEVAYKRVSVNDKSSRSNLQLFKPKEDFASLGKQISDLMGNIAGINVLRTGFNVGKPIVNGLHSSRVIVVNNGIRQEGQNWGMEHAPEIDAFLASEIELLKGANALRYGSDGIGAVILVNAPSIFNQKSSNLLSGEFNSLFQSNGRTQLLSGILKGNHLSKLPIYWRIQGTYNKTGNIKTSKDYIDNTGFREHNFSSELGYHTSRASTTLFYSSFNNQIGIYSGSQSGNLSDLQNAINSLRPLIHSDFTYQLKRPYQQVNHQLLKLQQKYSLNSKNGLELNASYQYNHRSEYDILRSSSSFSGPAFDYYIKTSLLELLWNHFNFHKSNFKIGSTAIHQSNAYTGKFFIPGFYNNAFGTFGIWEKKSKQWTYEASLRSDFRKLKSYLWSGDSLNIEIKNFHALTYFFKINHNINDRHQIAFNHGKTWRSPAVNELYSNGLHQGLASYERGNANLLPETAYNQSIEYHFNSKTIDFQMEYYYKLIYNFINLIPSNQSVLTIRGAYPAFEYIGQNVNIHGLNVYLNLQINNNNQLNFRANMLHSNELKTKRYLYQMPPYQFNFKYSKTIKNLHLNFSNITVLKQNRYELNTDYLPPPPAYSIFGIGLDYSFKGSKEHPSIGIQINNLFNSSYRDYLNRNRYFYDEAGRNIQIKLKWPIHVNQKTN